MIDAAQIRAARGLLDWTQGRLAEAADLALGTVKKAEREGADIRVSSLRAIQGALEQAGAIFLEPGDNRSGGKGVRLRD